MIRRCLTAAILAGCLAVAMLAPAVSPAAPAGSGAAAEVAAKKKGCKKGKGKKNGCKKKGGKKKPQSPGDGPYREGQTCNPNDGAEYAKYDFVCIALGPDGASGWTLVKND